MNISAPGHDIAGFVFAPTPVQSDQHNDTLGSPQNVDPNTDPTCVQGTDNTCIPTGQSFYNFFNSFAGDKPFGGSINWETPYVQIQGAGNGTFDVYSFEVTPDMLNPVASTIDGSTTAAHGPFYTEIGLALTGLVKVGDTWTLGLRDHDYSYTVMPGDTLTLAAVALKLRDLLNSSSNPVAGYSATAIGNFLT